MESTNHPKNLTQKRYLAMIHKHSSKITIYDFDSDTLKTHCVIGVTFNKLKWSPDGAYLAVTSRRSSSLYIFEVSTWEYESFDFHFNVTVRKF